MNDFQEQAKNWLRNVVKQNPDKIKAGVDKAGDLIDKQTGGKYAEKVDAVQQKVGTFVDKQTSEDTPAETTSDTTSESTTAGTAESDSAQSDGPAEAAGQAGTAGPVGATGTANAADGARVVGGPTPDPADNPERSTGSTTEGTGAGSTATGQQR
ncbi:antitoxin [Kribbella sp. NPDC051586]|uniref:antitoxin n=1 Tax=Kribbella sp. NPDC051586 TaxID=3364118 RepID=UPI0037AFCB4B